MFYVYEWFIVETGEVIYVGKGTRGRYKVRKHNRFFNDMINRFECDSRIVREFETEKEAFEFEYTHIEELRNVGQCVCNIRDGGTGGATDWWTDELRKKYSEKNVMKSEYQRKRMSENNPMKRKEIAEKTNSQKRVPIIIGDKEYPSIKEACIAYNTSWETIDTWCKKGINRYGEKCRRKGSPQAEFTDKRYNKGGSKAVVYEGVEYESVKDFAKGIGISECAANKWIRRGFNPYGVPCRYKDDARELVFEDRLKNRASNKDKAIIVNGITYPTCAEASKALGIAKHTLQIYARSDKKKKFYDCKYLT